MKLRALLLLSLAFPLLVSGATLVHNGQPAAVIVLPPQPDEFETRALGELTAHIEKISGAKLPSATVAAGQVASFTAEAKAKGQTPIFIGRNAGAALAKTLPPERGAFVLQVTKDAVMIAGNGEGPAYGVMELLEQLGCRWFMPGDLGTVIPQMKTVSLKEQTSVRVDFVAAKAELEKLDAVADKLMACKPVPMLSAGRFSTYVNYMKRFFRPCTEQGYECVTGGNRLVAAAKDEWDFQIDPQSVGEDIGFWRGDLTGGNWQTIKTTSSSWSNQGLRYCKGLAWYRQIVEVPAAMAKERIFFWCGAADEVAKVWINGKPIGISHGSAMSPFELDATGTVQPGKNVITVCVANLVVNELGTGGILAPVILYAPAGGKDAQLRNVRDLKPTFP